MQRLLAYGGGIGASTRGNGVELGEVEVRREIGIDWSDGGGCVGRLGGGWVGGGGTDWGWTGAIGDSGEKIGEWVGGECFVGGWAAGGDAEGGL